MNLQVLISTMDRKSITQLNLEQKKIYSDTIIVNQTDNNKTSLYNNIRMINYKEIGLSRSRNRALENASSEICIISDDDVEYVENFESIIVNAFKENEDTDIITFKIKTPQGENFKNYRNEMFDHDKRSILKVSSIEVAFKLESIKKNNIKFDEKFGLGSIYVSGEENIFLMDCINRGLKIKYIPITIAIHEKESSGRVLNEKAIYSKGALF